MSTLLLGRACIITTCSKGVSARLAVCGCQQRRSRHKQSSNTWSLQLFCEQRRKPWLRSTFPCEICMRNFKHSIWSRSSPSEGAWQGLQQSPMRSSPCRPGYRSACSPSSRSGSPPWPPVRAWGQSRSTTLSRCPPAKPSKPAECTCMLCKGLLQGKAMSSAARAATKGAALDPAPGARPYYDIRSLHSQNCI